MRILGAVLTLLGLIALGLDIYRSSGAEAGFEMRSSGAWWAELHRDSLLLLQPAVERHLTPALWDPGIQTLLEWPLAPQFLIPGVILLLLFRRRKPKAESGASSLTFGKR